MIGFAYGILVICCALCVYRVARGPTPADRIVGTDILGIVIVGFCSLVAITTKQEFYMYIALAWALLSFIGTIALAKFLEGKGFDE